MRYSALIITILCAEASAENAATLLSGEFDQLEWRSRGFAVWDGEIFFGDASDSALVLKTSGAAYKDSEKAHELQLLGQTAISQNWQVSAGLRADDYPDPKRHWAVLSLTGETALGTALEVTGYANDNNQSLLLGAEHFHEITPRLKIIPKAEFTFFNSDDTETSVGKGLSTVELGLRLRYVLSPQCKPYIGINWLNTYGNTRNISDSELSRTQFFHWRAGLTFAF